MLCIVLCTRSTTELSPCGRCADDVRVFLNPVASARRSGQEDFQRGTPPVSLASCSISPILRACIITEWSSKDHETDSTGISILIPLLLLNINMRLHGNTTAWYLFLATAHRNARLVPRTQTLLSIVVDGRSRGIFRTDLYQTCLSSTLPTDKRKCCRWRVEPGVLPTFVVDGS